MVRATMMMTAVSEKTTADEKHRVPKPESSSHKVKEKKLRKSQLEAVVI